jgi:L-asparaginase II
MARAMAWFASSADRTDTMSQAAWRLTQAMMEYPELVAGEDRACTDLMRTAKGRVALKTGAEGYFIAIIPEKKLGVALKIVDGATRASECAITAILVDLGVLDPADPVAQRYLNAPVTNWRGVHCGTVKPADGLFV